MLSHHDIDLVLDVGANVGNYARYLRAIGYKGTIVCFEPLSDAYSRLQILASRDTLLELAPRMALGDKDGDVLINIAGNSESSSILEMLDSHKNAAPDSIYVGSERAPLRKLDDVAPIFFFDKKAAFLKIDAQGYESRVLDGATNILSKIKGIQLELSLVQFYAGETLYRELIDRIESHGFKLYDLNPVFADDVTGRTYQLDGIFFKD
jgi:FkbM family methyltransferase